VMKHQKSLISHCQSSNDIHFGHVLDINPQSSTPTSSGLRQASIDPLQLLSPCLRSRPADAKFNIQPSGAPQSSSLLDPQPALQQAARHFSRPKRKAKPSKIARSLPQRIASLNILVACLLFPSTACSFVREEGRMQPEHSTGQHREPSAPGRGGEACLGSRPRNPYGCWLPLPLQYSALEIAAK
jgi:hypothetical protein